MESREAIKQRRAQREAEQQKYADEANYYRELYDKTGEERFLRQSIEFADKAHQSRNLKKGGSVKKYAKGGSVSKRADGCAIKGKTKGRMV